MCGALTGLVVELQLPAAPETSHVTVPVGAARVFEPVINATKVMDCPTVGVAGEALTNIEGVY